MNKDEKEQLNSLIASKDAEIKALQAKIDTLCESYGIEEIDVDVAMEHAKQSGWLPFMSYDLVQCGYPYPDHGEMVARPFKGTNEENAIGYGGGEWCRVTDAAAQFKKIDNKGLLRYHEIVSRRDADVKALQEKLSEYEKHPLLELQEISLPADKREEIIKAGISYAKRFAPMGKMDDLGRRSAFIEGAIWHAKKSEQLEGKQTGLQWVQCKHYGDAYKSHLRIKETKEPVVLHRVTKDDLQLINGTGDIKHALGYCELEYLDESAAVPDARQEAIAFADFINLDGYRITGWGYLKGSGLSRQCLSTEDVYNNFKDWQAKQKEVQNG